MMNKNLLFSQYAAKNRVQLVTGDISGDFTILVQGVEGVISGTGKFTVN